MAVTAKFQADFKSFISAIDSANVALADMGKGAERVEKTLNRMVDEFSGRKIIQDASLMTVAIEKAGGVSTLTARELAAVGGRAEEAADKMKKMGLEVPAGLQRLIDVTHNIKNAQTGAVESTRTFGDAMQQVDGILGQVGINLNQETKALTDIGAVVGKTTADLGLMATAGLAVGTAVAAWKVGRTVADFFDLDKAIADTTARLLGFGDVAGQEAAAKADTLARASKAAGFEVSQMSTAIVVLNEEAKRNAAALETSAAVTARWQGELKAVGDNTKQLTADIKSHNFSVEELATRYNMSAGAVKFYTNELEKSAAAEKAAADRIHDANARKLRDMQTELDTHKAFRDSMAELDSVGKGWAGTLDTIDGKVVEAIKYYIDAGVSLKALSEVYGLTDAQVKAVSSSMKAQTDATKALKEETDRLTKARAEATAAEEKQKAVTAAHTEELKKQQAAAAAAKKAMMEMGGSMDFDLSTSAGLAAFQKANPGARVSVGPEYFKTHTLQDAISAGYVDLYAAFKGLLGNKLPGFAGGVNNFSGGPAIVGEAGPELVTLPGGSSVTPLAGGGGGTYNFYLVDNSENLARKVSALIMRGTLRGGKVGI